ncbi:chemotaxis regulatory protein ChePep [Helicobacter pylori]|uniref:chemotaxis regulatory protein ChePep n=1 Tax=Helicobacter pylori TaxID=210 RepID=UPI000C30002E|nr:chemotaxis regulatory protein ChePep [Helicobacter pylori]
MKMILFNQNPMITKLLESVSKKLELSVENFNHYQELSARLKEEPEWVLIADDECLEKLDQVDWLELKEIISQNKNSVCMYKKGNEAQAFLEGFEMKIQKPFLPTEILKILQKKLGSNASELEPSQNLDPTQEVLETNWDELANLGDLEALAKEEPNNEEQLLPTLNDQEEKEEVKEEEKEEIKEEVKETPKEEEKPKEETQEGETPKSEEVSKELETQEEIKEEAQEEPIKKETQENKEGKQEKTQDSPSTQELEAMQELVKEIQENSNGQEDKKETQENAKALQETQENTETPQENAKALQETQAQELETQEKTETPQESAETPQETQAQELETQEKTETPQESAETPQETPQDVETPQAQDKETQEDHYESIEDIPEPVMAKAMGEELPFLNEAVAKIPNNENDTETPKESDIKTPQEKEESDKTSSPLELRLNLQDLLKSLNQESLKSLLENKTLSIKITLEDKKPDA